MKIALFHGFPLFHYEMLGYLIEYLLEKNIDFTIYTHFNNVKNEWEKYYTDLFSKYNKPINWSFIGNFSHDNYKYIVMITDDDILYLRTQQYFNPINKTKIITIDHSPQIRTPPVYKKICVSNFNPQFDFALPVYNNINKYEKNKLLNDQPKINISMIGSAYIKSVDKLKNLFINYNDIQFNIISRFYNKEFENQPNIKVYQNCNTSLMMDLVKNSHYVLFNIDATEYIFGKMSGAIPLGISSLCCLIIPSSWNLNYNFKSVIEYDYNSKIELSKDIDLNKIENELNELLLKRNSVFNNTFV